MIMTSRHSVNSSANSDAPATKIRRTEAQTEASNSTASTSAAISRRDGGASTDATSSKASNAKADQKAVKSDSLADNLTCIICQSVFHDCVSVQPCLHSFCAGCLSEWLGKSDSCPVCRKTVELVSTNHTLSGCVASLVAQRPELGRTSSDIRELDAKNKIPKSSVLKFDRDARRKFAGDYADGEDDNDDDGDGEDEDDEDEEDDEDNGAGDNAAPQLYAAGFNIRCRQCPGNSLRLSNEDVSSGAPPADSDVQIYVVDVRNPSGFSDQPLAAASNSAAISGAACSSYICSAEQVHVLCECCREAMPSRARPGIPTWLVPPQRCAVCERVYCHAYWKCKRRASPCYGCLAPLRSEYCPRFAALPVESFCLFRNCANAHTVRPTLCTSRYQPWCQLVSFSHFVTSLLLVPLLSSAFFLLVVFRRLHFNCKHLFVCVAFGNIP